MTHLEENARLSHELEEARDTIERLIEEKAGIARQRDEMKRQLDIALGMLPKTGDPMQLFGVAPDLGDVPIGPECNNCGREARDTDKGFVCCDNCGHREKLSIKEELK